MSFISNLWDDVKDFGKGVYNFVTGVDSQRETMGIQNNLTQENMRLGADIQKDVWNYTNFENQMKHIKAAGLSPGLIYGQAGAGGASTGSGSGPSAGGAGAAPNVIGMALQLKNLNLAERQMDINEKIANADINLKTAEANKANEEAGTQGSIRELNKVTAELKETLKTLTNKQTELTEAEIGKTFQETNRMVQEAAKAAIEGRGMELQNKITQKEVDAWDEKFDLWKRQQRASIGLTLRQTKHFDAIENYWTNQVMIGRYDSETGRSKMLNEFNLKATELGLMDTQYKHERMMNYINALTLGVASGWNMMKQAQGKVITTESTTVFPNGNTKTTTSKSTTK